MPQREVTDPYCQLDKPDTAFRLEGDPTCMAPNEAEALTPLWMPQRVHRDHVSPGESLEFSTSTPDEDVGPGRTAERDPAGPLMTRVETGPP